MKNSLYILSYILFVCTCCDFNLKSLGEQEESVIKIYRYDRLESRYLTTGDFSALQQMNTEYPIETRTLVENVLKIGAVYEPNINNKFLSFYQDTTLQTLISDAEAQYANMDDIKQAFNDAFARLRKKIPGVPIPDIYTQIGALNQSVVIGDKLIGISLDKYLGEDYPLYLKYYPKQQRMTMTREYIVPDGLSFYLLSLYPLENLGTRSQREHDLHMGKMMWVTNRLMHRKFFSSPFVASVDRFMASHPTYTIKTLLESNDYRNFK
ncbi:gliding motility protein GldB [Prevotella sp. A2931]|uniref:Gliding motility protein GldB n=1 Tax=Prevotella illustrans TaxID=2800387 RepID=A0ABS3M3Q4_9BACT|nr:gliding motility protein GldB [Prevotella illustrans]